MIDLYPELQTAAAQFCYGVRLFAMPAAPAPHDVRMEDKERAPKM